MTEGARATISTRQLPQTSSRVPDQSVYVPRASATLSNLHCRTPSGVLVRPLHKQIEGFHLKRWAAAYSRRNACFFLRYFHDGTTYWSCTHAHTHTNVHVRMLIHTRTCAYAPMYTHTCTRNKTAAPKTLPCSSASRVSYDTLPLLQHAHDAQPLLDMHQLPFCPRLGITHTMCVACLWHVCGMFVACLWHVCGMTLS